MTKQIKGRTAPAPEAGRQSKPEAPRPGARVKAGAPFVALTREGAPTKGDARPARAARRDDRVKPALSEADLRPPRAGDAMADFGPQQPKPPAGGAVAAPREQYVRLRVRVRDGRLSVVDSHLVDGPLVAPRTFGGSNAYELTLDDRLIYAGDLPDLGVQRSFANPDRKAPKEQRGHHFTERDIYEFTARVPAAAVTRETIPRLTLRLHRVKEEARTTALRDEPLARQFEREMRPVAELVGLPESVLPEAIERRGGRTPAI